ncbi:molybdate ABC transporter substrate-binding protein [Pyrinomonas methylaliphatogenes]|uniref:Molybdate-binding protein ModA n=1 Tax=Pyrinomonas methylaliphatogenes TaxID=454194 RepID=A0A0B6WYN1_9BACT|nr:molybdate ABC transporter substrate-binding protein [Pyrinomonas methylaliphatogenes]CDM65409.1 molybdenum ABC transporter, periplasmic molybdate-binding protein [Pyrinomonas methylaliphatogenes]
MREDLGNRRAPAELRAHAGRARNALGRIALVLVLTVICCAAACERNRTPATEKREVVVFAAASLTEAFREMATEFERARPGLRVAFNFAGSAQLRTQLAQGARADVFASADERNMNAAVAEGTVAPTPALFARNQPVIVVPADNPAQIAALADLAKPGVRLVLAAQDVPIGGYAREVLARASRAPNYGGDFAARVQRNVVSEETNVRAALAKVALGEASATFVYRTDVTADVRDRVRIIEIPDEFNVVAEYYIAPTKNAPNPAGARAFIDFVLSDRGQQVLAERGFKPAR